MLFGASLGVFVAQSFLQTPQTAIIFTCVIEILATVWILTKIFRYSGEESLYSWVLAITSFGFSTAGAILLGGYQSSHYWYLGVAFANGFVVVATVLLQWAFDQNKRSFPLKASNIKI